MARAISPRMTVFDPDAAALPGSGIYGLSTPVEDAALVLVPVPFAATTSYGGGAEGGPAAILAASHQVDLFDPETHDPYAHGIAMLPEAPAVASWHAEARALAQGVISVGGRIEGDDQLKDALRRVNALCADLNAYVYETVTGLIARGKLVVTVGGDHAVPYGAIQAHAERYPGMGILHLDAHADLRTAYEGFVWSHASIMANVMDGIPAVSRLVQVGLRDVSTAEHRRITASDGRIVAFFDAALAAERFEGMSWARQVARVIEALPREVYLSVDIDGLDPVLCPHTGTPVPGGLSFQQAAYLVGAVARSGRVIVGADLVEVAPGPDGDEWDGNVAARLLYKMIGWMVGSGTQNGVQAPSP